MKNTSSSPKLAVKIVLEAVTSETPNLRYLSGKDVETWLDVKRNMSDINNTIKVDDMNRHGKAN